MHKEQIVGWGVGVGCMMVAKETVGIRLKLATPVEQQVSTHGIIWLLLCCYIHDSIINCFCSLWVSWSKFAMSRVLCCFW